MANGSSQEADYLLASGALHNMDISLSKQKQENCIKNILAQKNKCSHIQSCLVETSSLKSSELPGPLNSVASIYVTEHGNRQPRFL